MFSHSPMGSRPGWTTLTCSMRAGHDVIASPGVSMCLSRRQREGK